MQVSSRSWLFPMRRFSSGRTYDFKTLAVSSPKEHVLHVQLSRPDVGNAMNQTMWRELGLCFDRIAADDKCRAVVLSASGGSFTHGLDLKDHTGLTSLSKSADVSRTSVALQTEISKYQNSISMIENCPQPVIAAVHGPCIGGGLDLISACDVRLAASEAWFSIKEVDVGLAADLGTLQRLPKVVSNHSLLRELAFTSRRFDAKEAAEMGMISEVLQDREELVNAAVGLAEEIASKSPIAVSGTKHNLVYSRDHSVADGLNYVAAWNMTGLQSPDIRTAGLAFIMKKKGSFPSLARIPSLIERIVDFAMSFNQRR